jgi:hypothetical protein
VSIINTELGAVNIYLGKVYMGKTQGGCTWAIESDDKEITHDQDGTKPQNYFRTGKSHKITTSLSQATIERLCLADNNFKSTALNQSLNFDATLYQSAQSECKTLVLEDINDASATGRLLWYKARMKITGTVFEFGPDKQKVIPVEIMCFKDTTYNSFGYYGNPNSLGIGSIDGV